jgi:hypothetical protein
MEYSTASRGTCDNPATNVAALACPSGVGHEERIEGETSGNAPDDVTGRETTALAAPSPATTS